jgi:hypothetical protein
MRRVRLHGPADLRLRIFRRPLVEGITGKQKTAWIAARASEAALRRRGEDRGGEERADCYQPSCGQSAAEMDSISDATVFRKTSGLVMLMT